MAAALFAQANDLMLDDQPEDALELYNQAVLAAPKDPNYLAQRAACYIRLRNYNAALQDADAAIAADSSLSAPHFRRGVALFYLDDFANAKQALLKAQELGYKNTDLWLRKCDAELAELARDAPVEGTTAEASKRVEEEAAVEAPKPQTLAEKMKFAWVQKPDSVAITFYVKGLPKENAEIKFGSKTIDVRLTLPDGSIFERHFDLFAEVELSSCRYDLNAYKLIIHLKKSVALDWDDLMSVVTENVVLRPHIRGRFDAVPAYPSSSTKKKDWGVVEKEVVAEESSEKPAGDAALTKLFQDIYSKADEDTRRAMIKSFQTSGGTVLSTNWNEVREKDYDSEISAPKGMEVRRWKDL